MPGACEQAYDAPPDACVAYGATRKVARGARVKDLVLTVAGEITVAGKVESALCNMSVMTRLSTV